MISFNESSKSPNDASRFIAETHFIDSSEVAENTSYALDLEAIEKEARFDGFYAICSNLEDETAVEIIRANSQRWEIEDMFRTLKTEFESRPVYLRRNDPIVAHFKCFPYCSASVAKLEVEGGSLILWFYGSTYLNLGFRKICVNLHL